MKARKLDGRYKAGVDYGAMSYLGTILPLKSYSVLKSESIEPTPREKQIQKMKKKGINKTRAEKYFKQKFSK